MLEYIIIGREKIKIFYSYFLTYLNYIYYKVFTMVCSMLSIFYIIIIYNIIIISCERLTEEQRIANWYHHNNTWPPKWQPEKPLFTLNMEKREVELQMIPGSNERWENYMQYTQSRLVPRFTENGTHLYT